MLSFLKHKCFEITAIMLVREIDYYKILIQENGLNVHKKSRTSVKICFSLIFHNYITHAIDDLILCSCMFWP